MGNYIDMCMTASTKGMNANLNNPNTDLMPYLDCTGENIFRVEQQNQFNSIST